MTIKTVLTVLGTLYKMTPEQVSEAFEISAETPDTEEIDDEKVKNFLLDKQAKLIKERDDMGYKRAEKEVLKKFEKEVKTKYGVESDLKGAELISHIVEEHSKGSGDGKKLTDEEIKKHPLYLKLETEKKTEIENLNKTWEGKVKEVEEGRNYEKLLEEVDSEALTIFKGMGEAILPEDKAIADKHIKRLLLDELKQGHKFQKTGDKDFLILDEDGNRMEDKAGNAKKLSDLVSEIAKGNFQFKKAKDREAPGNGKDGKKPEGSGQKKYTGKAPQSKQEYMDLLLNDKLDTETRSDIKAQFSEQFNT